MSTIEASASGWHSPFMLESRLEAARKCAPRYSLVLVVLLLAIVDASAVSAAEPRAADAASCHRVALEQSPSFSYSASWSADGRQLLIAGPLDGKVFTYDDQGGLTGTVENPGMGSYEFIQPHGVQALPDGGLLIHEAENHSVWYDSELEGFRSVYLEAVPSPPLEHISAIERLWNGEHLVTRAYLQLDGQARTGFARFTLDQEPRFLDLAVAFADDPWDMGARYQRMTGPALALAKGRVYGLVFGSPSRLHLISPTVEPLEAFPSGYESLPPLPKTPGNALGTALQLKFIQRQSVPVALYGHGPHLYLLTRDPLRTEEGYKTTWRLHQIDPDADKLIRSITLPTQTEHLLLAPGSRYWALIEKGPVNEVAQHEIKTMVLVPTPWIEDPANPRLREGGDAPVCN